MSANLHLDLLKEEERLSSSPVRLRVLVPILAISTAAGCLLWCLYLSLGQRDSNAMRARLQTNINELTSAHEAFLSLVQEERETSAMLHQLRYYEHAQIRVGGVLMKLPDLIPAGIQLAEIRIQPPAPPPPQPDPKLNELGPTNTLEIVSMKIAGRAFGDDASSRVDALLASLRAPEYAAVIPEVVIPKGAFRQDFGYLDENRKAFLFEINCVFAPRRFE